jgi:O-antigen ligase
MNWSRAVTEIKKVASGLGNPRITPSTTFVLGVLIGAVSIGVLIGFLGEPALRAVVGLSATIAIILVVVNKRKVYYSLLLIIFATTLARETLGLPLEADAPTVALLIAVLLISKPKALTRIPRYPLAMPVMGYLITNFISSYNSSYPHGASLRQAAILVYRALTFYLVVGAVYSFPSFRHRYTKFLGWLMIFHVTVSLLVLLVRPDPSNMVLQSRYEGISIKGFFEESNLLGIFTLCVVAMCVGTYVHNNSTKRRIELILMVVVGIIGILLSYTRSTWLGLGLVVGVSAIVLGSDKRMHAGLLRLILALLLVAVPFLIMSSLAIYSTFRLQDSRVIDGLLTRLGQIVSTDDPSAAGRLFVWREALLLWRQHPWLGSGLLSYQFYSQQNEGWLYNFLVQSLHDSGIIGTFFLLWIFAGALLYVLKAYRIAQDQQDKGTLLGYALALVSLYFTSLFSSFMWGAFAWILLGLSIGHSLIVVRQHKKTLAEEDMSVPTSIR